VTNLTHCSRPLDGFCITSLAICREFYAAVLYTALYTMYTTLYDYERNFDYEPMIIDQCPSTPIYTLPNSALHDSLSVKIPGLLGSTVTSHHSRNHWMQEYFKLVSEWRMCKGCDEKIHLLIFAFSPVLRWAQAVTALNSDRSLDWMFREIGD